MAQSDFTLFDETPLGLSDGSHNLGSDTFSVILITTLPTASDATPDRADYTEVTAGGGYTTGGIALTTTWIASAATATFDDSVDPTWSAAAGSPTNCVAALIVNDTHAGTNDAIGFIDLTTDSGTTPLSLVDGDIAISWNASGILRSSRV